MNYGLLLALLAAFVILGVVAASFVLVGSIRRDRRQALRWAMLLGVCLLLAGGTGLALAARVATSARTRIVTAVRDRRARIAAETRKKQARDAADLARFQRKIDALNRCVSPAVAAKIPPDFYSYDGIFDWWRRPLVYPYSMVNIDTSDSPGQLCRFKGGDVRNPNPASEDQLGYGIRAYAFDCQFLLMRRVTGDEEGRESTAWELFEFTGGSSTRFPSEVALFAEARRRGYSGEGQLKTVKERFNEHFEP